MELREAMKRLGEREIGSILVEGGGVLNGALLEAGLADKIVLFLAPKIIGGWTAPASFRMEGFARMAEAIRLNGMEVQSFGEDVCITGYPEYGGDADVYRNH